MPPKASKAACNTNATGGGRTQITEADPSDDEAITRGTASDATTVGGGVGEGG